MKPTSWSTLGWTALAAAVVGWAALRVWMSGGGGPIPVPVASMLLLAAIAVIVLVAAWPVRKWNSGVRTKAFDPLRAARAAVLAKASAFCGAVLIGWYSGQALLLAGDLGIEPLRNAFWSDVAGAVLAAGTVIAGMVAESWCRVNPEDDEDDDAGLQDSEPGLA